MKNVSESIAKQTKTVYEDYLKIKGFEDVGYFLQNYVVSGGVVTKNVTRNDMIDVSDIVVVLKNDVAYRKGSSFRSRIPNATYYLDFQDGDFEWGTTHPKGTAGTDYLTIATVTTDANENINAIIDTRGPVGGFRLKSEYGLENYVSKTEFNADINEIEGDIETLQTTKADASDLEDTNNQVSANTAALAQKADISYVNQQISNMGDAKPKGVYATLADLQTAYPSGAEGIYLVTADGHWYYWSGTAWTDGGQYQSTGIADGSVTAAKRTATGEQAFVFGANPVKFDLANSTVTFSPTGTTHRVYYRGTIYQIPADTVVNLTPSLGTAGKLYFDIVTNQIRVYWYNENVTDENEVMIGAYTTGVNGDIVFNGNYDAGFYSGEMAIIFGLQPVKVDFSNTTITFSPFGVTHRLYHRNTFYDIPNTVFDFTPPTLSAGKIYYNVPNQTFVVYDWNVETPKKQEILVAVFSLPTSSIYMTGSYEVVDQPFFDGVFTNLEDCANSWWVYPLAKRYVGYRDKTYIGYTDSQGYSGVASIDNSTGQVVKKRLKIAEVDDHNAVCVDVMQDGRLIVAYATGHNTDNYMHVRISSKKESVEEFGEDILINAGNVTTYSQLFYKNSKWWLFYRVGTANWAYTSSTDGETWSTPTTIIVGGMQYYCKIMDTTDPNLLRLVMYSNPNATDTNIRLGFFDTSTSELKLQDGTVLGTADISKDSFPIIIPVEPGKRQRLLDVAVTAPTTTAVAYAVFTNANDAEYKVAFDNAGTLQTYSVVAAGTAFFIPSVYVGGIVFGDENTIYLSRNTGTGWTIEKWTKNGSSFAMSETIRTVTQGVAIRPALTKDGDKLFWQEGYFNQNNFSDFQTDLKYEEV